MYSIDVDISEVHALTRAAVKELGAVPERLKKHLAGVAKVERSTHKYKNRTYRLQGSTFALGPIGGTDYTETEIGARMPYASFVERRGLSRITDLSKAAENEVEFMFETIGLVLSEM